MEEQLLIAGQARYVHTAKSALAERPWRIVELPAAEVGLADDGGGRELSREPGAFEAVKDKVQAELVFVAVVVAGLEDVLDRQLGQAWVLLCGELQQESFCQL